MAYVPPHRRRRQRPQETEERIYPGHRRAPPTPRSHNHQRDSSSQRLHQRIFGEAIDHIYCINLANRPERWHSVERQVDRLQLGVPVQRFQAVNGRAVMESGSVNENDVCCSWNGDKNHRYSASAKPGPRTMRAGEVGCALSHIALWRTLVDKSGPSQSNEEEIGRNSHAPTMLVLEDDVLFDKKCGKYRFLAAFCNAWKQLSSEGGGWDMLYLGLSDRGERSYVGDERALASCDQFHPVENPRVRLYRPEYGYHTHAYVITQRAAATLLSNLPIVGPIDVWLADNNWFGMKVFGTVIAEEGWKLPDGTHEGKDLVVQSRRDFDSDIQTS